MDFLYYLIFYKAATFDFAGPFVYLPRRVNVTIHSIKTRFEANYEE